MRVPALLLTTVFWFAACDNVGRAFDPNPGPVTGAESLVDLMPEGGDARDGRPTVQEVFPTGSGWPGTVPIVLVFSESLRADSVLPAAPGGLGGVTVQLEGSGQPIPVSYDLLEGNRVLLMRPTDLPGREQGLPFEILVDPEVRDVDGIRYGGTELDVVGTFQANQAESFADGAVVTVLPVDNADGVDEGANVYAIFDKEPLAGTVDNTTAQVRLGGTPIQGTWSPLSTVGVADRRVMVFDPTSPLTLGAEHEVVFQSGIEFADDGVLDFRGRTPFARFETLAFGRPEAVRVGNPTMGFADKVNRSNLQNLLLDVDVPASSLAGDRVAVRLYGLESETAAEGDVGFEERFFEVPANGAQTVSVPFGEVTGTLAAPRFGDGSLLFAAQLQRGSRRSGFALSDEDADPAQDLVAPELLAVGPPTIEGTLDILTDQEALVFFGTASEELGDASLTDGTSTVGSFASTGSRFALAPLALGRRTAPLPYTLNLTDAAGNMSAQAFTGQIHQRGVVTGALAGSVTVEAYDRSTLLPVSGATVVLESGVPTVPATAQQVATTDAAGRAVFASVAGRYTVTIEAAQFDLTTLYNAGSAFVSLPLEPEADASAELSGTATISLPTIPNGTSVRVGSNLSDEVVGIATTTSEPTLIPDSPILANRPQVLTAFASVFEPNQTPAVVALAVEMAGSDMLTPTAPATPTAPGQSRPQSLVLIPAATGLVGDLSAPYTVNLATAAGFDGANLAVDPVARITVGLSGFGGQVLMGIGTTNTGGGAVWSIDGTYAVAALATLGPFSPAIWSVLEATDQVGAVLRHRALVFADGTFLNIAPVPGMPTITGGGTFTGAPLLTLEDRLNRGAIVGGQAMWRFELTDGAGRRWNIYREDRDIPSGTETVQVPDLTGVGTGLALGTWNVRSEAWLYFSTAFSAGEFVLEERVRSEVTYARAADTTITVQ